MTFARACVHSSFGFPARLDLLGAEFLSFGFADESADRAHAASAFRRTAQRRIDVEHVSGVIQRRYGRPNIDLRQHIARTDDHPCLPGDGGPHQDFYTNRDRYFVGQDTRCVNGGRRTLERMQRIADHAQLRLRRLGRRPVTIAARFDLANAAVRFERSIFKIRNMCYTSFHSTEKLERLHNAPTEEMAWLKGAERIA